MEQERGGIRAEERGGQCAGAAEVRGRHSRPDTEARGQGQTERGRRAAPGKVDGKQGRGVAGRMVL
jgi:hypothetical protein